jgi:hypothetical protein
MARDEALSAVRELKGELSRFGVRGFALIGDGFSIVSTGSGEYVVKTGEVDWNHMYLRFRRHPVIIAVGSILVALSLTILAMVIMNTGPAVTWPMDARFFSIMLPLIMGILFLAGSRVKAILNY